MISTTQDLHTFISALHGRQAPAGPAAGRDAQAGPDGIGYGLGVFVQDDGLGGGTVITHNGGILGYAALMYSTPDGSKTLTASLNYVDDAAMSHGSGVPEGPAEARQGGVLRRAGRFG